MSTKFWKKTYDTGQTQAYRVFSPMEVTRLLRSLRMVADTRIRNPMNITTLDYQKGMYESKANKFVRIRPRVNIYNTDISQFIL